MPCQVKKELDGLLSSQSLTMHLPMGLVFLGKETPLDYCLLITEPALF